MTPSLPENEEQRRRAVALAVALMADTPLAPKRYERQLLARYEQGELSIDQVLDLLKQSTYQVLYHSRATQRPTEAQLQELLQYSRSYNTQHQITGLLLYSDGYFVQVLEGAEEAVKVLYEQIQRDARHTQVVTVSAGAEPARLFADWSMGFGYVTESEAGQVLQAMQGQHSSGLEVDDVHLRTLLQAFGITT
jgi:hypothetical protein